MNYDLIYPMAAMVLLTVVVLFTLFRKRVAAVKHGEVRASYYKTFQGENTEPRDVAQVSRHFVNLFEAPVLFYTACIVGLVTGLGGQLLVVTAWVFVLARTAHAAVHLGANKINPRIGAYFFSWILLLIMWGVIVFGAATLP